jgi:hypothetical protein
MVTIYWGEGGGLNSELLKFLRYSSHHVSGKNYAVITTVITDHAYVNIMFSIETYIMQPVSIMSTDTRISCILCLI